MNILVKRWSFDSGWNTTVENFGSQHLDEKAMGRFLSVLVDRGLIGEEELSFIFDREVEIERLAPEGCLKIWEIK